MPSRGAAGGRKPGVHTVWRSKARRWVNVKSGSDGLEDDATLLKYLKKVDAVRDGREVAVEEKLEHFIHRKDGEISERNSYGGDPKRRRG